MRCVYCDTAYAFHGGKSMELTDVMQEVSRLGAHYVTVTGGEPLAQKECETLLHELCDAGYDVSLETGGAMDISRVDPRVSIILDIKTPDSGEASKNRWENLAHIKSMDEIKFVLCGRGDYEWAKEIMFEHDLAGKCSVLFSPVYQQLNPTQLAEWVLQDKLPVRMQVQLHKILWGETPGK